MTDKPHVITAIAVETLEPIKDGDPLVITPEGFARRAKPGERAEFVARGIVCMHCHRTRDEHAGSQCLFESTRFTNNETAVRVTIAVKDVPNE